jgi:drug/metabolite transporter (DMT)-like permease
VGWLWFRFPLRRTQVVGLALGFVGVLVLAWGRMSFKPGGSGWAILAGLTACLCYGIAAHFARRHLAGVPAQVVTMGSMTGAALSLIPLGWWQWPPVAPSIAAWECALTLGILCTAIAYFIYYHLLDRGGPTTATAVTFVVPVFAILWGTIFLHEKLTVRMLGGMAVTLLGTAFTTGLLGPKSKR